MCKEEGHPSQFPSRYSERFGNSNIYTDIINRSAVALHRIENCSRVFFSRGRTAHVPGPDLPLCDVVVHSLADPVGMVVQTEVTKHHASAQKQGRRIGLVLALDIETNMSASRLEHGNFPTHVATWDDSRSTDESSADVGENATVQVWRDHDVELLWARHALHASVVDNHVVGGDGGEVLADALHSVAEKTVCQLHDVGLVDDGDLLAVVGKGERVCEFGNALRLRAGNDLEGFDDTRNGLMFQATVFALGVLSDDAEIDVLVAGLVARDVLDQYNGSVDVEFLTKSDVEGDMAGARDWGVKDAWGELILDAYTQTIEQEFLVPFSPTLLRFKEATASRKSSSVCLSPLSTPDTSSCSHSTGTLSALKISRTDSDTSAPIPSPNWYSASAVLIGNVYNKRTRNQSNCVFTTELARLENVRRDVGHRYRKPLTRDSSYWPRPLLTASCHGGARNARSSIEPAQAVSCVRKVLLSNCILHTSAQALYVFLWSASCRLCAGRRL